MARTIKATFEISEDSNLGSMKLTIGRKAVTFDDLTEKERIHMLNLWGGMYRLHYECYFKEKEE